MEFNAVYHQASDNYCYPLNEDELIINIKTGYDVKSVSIILGDPFAAGILGGGEHWDGKREPIIYKKRLKNQIWWTTTVRPEYKRLKYYFELQTGEESWFYFEDGFVSSEQMHLEGRSRQCFVFPWMNPCDVPRTPAWVNDTVWYQIFPDRFCNGDPSNDPENVVLWREHGSVTNEECFGGDLAGITDKLDYLQNLGINGLYLTPINEAPSNHKYDTTDYTKIDPRFGDEETFKHLVKEAHKRGIRVMLDGVFNHSGYYFAPWQDVLAKGPESEYYDWFMINEWPFDKNGQAAKKKQYYTFAFFDSMPKINTNNPKVRKYFVDICANWVENYGIDGIRLDVANEVSHRFCKELHARVKEINPDIYILGEIWHNALPWLRGDEFDAVMNYPLGQSIKDFWIDKSLTNEDFEYTINRCYTSYMQQTNDVLFNLLDSHDTKRLRSDVKNLDEYFAQIAVLFAMPGSPCIYYGTEIAMEGSYDPDCRRCMPWSDIEAGKYAERSRIISTLIHLRRQEPLLKSRNFHFPNDYAAYRRVIQFQKVDFPDCYVEVLINCCEEDVEVVPQGEILETVLQSDIEKIKMTLEEVDRSAFERAADTILSARTIYIVGIRSCAPLASFLAFYFHMIFPDVRQVQTNSSSEIFEQMIRITEDDVVIGISFPRYSMRTMKALEFANSRKAKVITITDSVHSPMNVYAACTLIAKSDMASIVDSLVAPLSVINALVVALCMKRQADVKKTLESMEKLWDEYQVYSNDEINGLDDARPMGGKKAALPVKEKA